MRAGPLRALTCRILGLVQRFLEDFSKALAGVRAELGLGAGGLGGAAASGGGAGV